MLGLQIREAAKSLLKGSRKLTKYTNEYYRKYRSLTQAEKLRDYLLQHSHQRPHRHHHHYCAPHAESSSHRRRDTSHRHQCCCSKKMSSHTTARRTDSFELPSSRRAQTYEYKSKYVPSSSAVNSHMKVFSTKSDPHPEPMKYKTMQNVCHPVHCPYQYYSEPHLFSETQPLAHSLRDPPTCPANRGEERHVRFLNPLHTSAPNLGCRSTRVLPITPQDKLVFTPTGASALSRHLKGYLTVPRSTLYDRRQSKLSPEPLSCRCRSKAAS